VCLNKLCLKSDKTACSRATLPVFFESMFSSARHRVVSGCAAAARLGSLRAPQGRDRPETIQIVQCVVRYNQNNWKLIRNPLSARR